MPDIGGTAYRGIFHEGPVCGFRDGLHLQPMRKFNHFVFDIPVADCIMMVDAVVDDRADKLRNGKDSPRIARFPIQPDEPS